MTEFKDLAVEGQAIFEMPESMRWAEIVDPEPRYEEIPSLQTPGETKEKLIMNVRLSNGSLAEYYPNKTSARFIASRLGTNMKNWKGNIIVWGSILDQNVAGQKKKVLYVNEIRKPRHVESVPEKAL